MPRVTARATATRFEEVDPAHSDPAFRRYIASALKLLQKSDVPEAKRTLQAINSGRVKVDLFSDLTAKDFRHMTKDMKGTLNLVPADRARLHRSNSKAFTGISRTLNGYMWDDRVYVHRDLSARKLASTLVHEVTHVLNRSEENYRSPKAALLEEYRSFYAERRFAGVEMTPARCRTLKQYIIREYELKGVTPDDVPDVPPSNPR